MSDNEPTSLEQKWAAEAEIEAQSTDEEETETVVPGEVEELRQEVVDLKDQLLRRQAELINFRRRSERERADRVDAARAEVVRQLLPVIDNLDRAIGAGTDNLDAYREGVELILHSLHEALERIGVEKLDPAGETFDPHLHEALDQVASEETPAGHIVQVYQPGYRFGTRLLRAAVVSVSTGDEAPEQADE